MASLLSNFINNLAEQFMKLNVNMGMIIEM